MSDTEFIALLRLMFGILGFVMVSALALVVLVYLYRFASWVVYKLKKNHDHQ